MYYNREETLARGKRDSKMFVRIFGGGFLAVGIILFAVCIYVYVSGTSFKEKAQPVQAVILAMQGATSESLGTPLLEYVVGGKTYTTTLNMSSSSMHPGKQITVYYRVDNPQEVRYLDADKWVIAILLVMGFVFGGIGTVVLVLRRRSRQRVSRLLSTGDVLEAEITDIREDHEQSMRGRHPIVISCRYTAPDGRIHLFQSGSFWYASHAIDPKKKVRVYVDRNNPSTYYVDVDSVVG